MNPDDNQSGIIRKGKARKLNIQDVQGIARLVSESFLTETEACHVLGIQPNRWFIFKQRAKIQAKFESLTTRIKGSQIENCIKRIQDSGDGRGGVKQPDWRAKAFILNVIDRKRFGTTGDAIDVNRPQNYNITIITDSIRRAYSDAGGALIDKGVSGQPLIELKPVAPSVGGVKVPKRKS